MINYRRLVFLYTYVKNTRHIKYIEYKYYIFGRYTKFFHEHFNQIM